MLSRMDAQDLLPTQNQSCCLNDIVSDLIEELAPISIQAKITINLKVTNHIPIYAIGNEEQIYRLIFNIFINAIHYTAAGGTVQIALDTSDRHAVVHIDDNGIGISDVDLPHIFDRFYRAHSDRSRQTGGTGLGLAIAIAIAKSHHGNIQVSSQLGKGSSFSIRLPLYDRANCDRTQ
jgi:signal transduction histidine kinase